MTQLDLAQFLARHASFGGWREEWSGVPLEFRACLADEIPPRAFVGSVRSIVLHEDTVLAVGSAQPILSVGGRCQSEETIEQTLLREVGEESGWIVKPLGVIGFIHCRHLDEQRPDWGRPAPDFVDPIFVSAAIRPDATLLAENEPRCCFVPIADVERLGVEKINKTYLNAALAKRSEF
jgi:8-oxo-dGTP pyrophosphatase MutT (NUDIX family)